MTQQIKSTLPNILSKISNLEIDTSYQLNEINERIVDVSGVQGPQGRQGGDSINNKKSIAHSKYKTSVSPTRLGNNILHFNPYLINVGDVPTGETRMITFNLKNNSLSSIILESVEADGNISFSTDFSFPYSLSGGDTTNLSIYIRPDDTISYYSHLYIFDAVLLSSGILGIGAVICRGVINCVSITPLILNFGDVYVGHSVTSNAQVTNESTTKSITLNNIIIGSALITTTQTLPFKITGGSEISVPFTFSPTATGQFTGNITFTDEFSQTRSIEWYGNGIQNVGDFTLSPSSFSFGEILIGQEETKAITLSTTSPADDQIVSIVSSDSTVTTNHVTPFIITGSGSTQVVFKFKPLAIKKYTGTITFTDQNNNVRQADWEGLGTDGTNFLVTPSTLNFGDVEIGANVTRNAQVTNISLLNNITINEINIPSSHVTTTKIIPFQLSVEEFQQVPFTFIPPSIGEVSGWISFTDDKSHVRNIGWLGTGISNGANFELSTSSFSFPAVELGNSSRYELLLNTTNIHDDKITKITQTGPNIVYVLDSLPITILGNGGSAVVNIEFAPTAYGNPIGTITFEDQNENSHTVSWNGSCVDRIGFSVNPDIVDFGEVAIGESFEIEITLINNSSIYENTIKSVKIDSKKGVVTMVSLTPITIPVGDTTKIIFKFEPLNAESYIGNIYLFDKYGFSVTIPWTGVGQTP